MDGTIPCPPQFIPNPNPTADGPSSITHPAFLIWWQQDQIILSTLNSSLSKGVLSQVVGLATSRDVWLTLERLFSSHSQAHIMQIRYQLYTMKKGNLLIADYYQKIKYLLTPWQLLDNFYKI